MVCKLNVVCCSILEVRSWITSLTDAIGQSLTTPPLTQPLSNPANSQFTTRGHTANQGTPEVQRSVYAKSQIPYQIQCPISDPVSHTRSSVPYQIMSALYRPAAKMLSTSVIKELYSIPGNDACADCGTSKPKWARYTC